MNKCATSVVILQDEPAHREDSVRGRDQQRDSCGVQKADHGCAERAAAKREVMSKIQELREKPLDWEDTRIQNLVLLNMVARRCNEIVEAMAELEEKIKGYEGGKRVINGG